MTRPRSRYPVSSFGPELMAVLLKGAREEVRIPCRDAKQAQHLQARIHALRGAMNREKHPQYELSTRARTARDWKIGEDGKAKDFALIIRPNDSQFADIIKAAGIEVTDERDLLEETAPPLTPKDPSTQPDPEPTNPRDIYGDFK